MNNLDGKELKEPVVGYFVSLPATPIGDAFAWVHLAGRIWKFKVLIVVASLIVGVGFWWLGSLVKPTYRAEAVVVLVEQEGASRSTAVAGQLGRLASLAGLSAGDGSDRQELLAVLSSRSLYATFIEKEGLLPILFPDRWDGEKQQWRSAGKPATAPTMDQAIEKLRRSVLKVAMDRNTGLVRVAAEHPDPQVATRLVNALLRVGNEQVRAKVAAEATRSLEYLEKELSTVRDIESRQLIAQLMQGQISTRMLTSVRSDYAYKVVDPAFEPDRDRYVKPRRAVYAAIGMFVGFFLTALWAVWRRAG